MKTADSAYVAKFSIDGMMTLWRASATICDMKRPTLAVRQYRHSSTHPYYLDLRAFNQGRKFFKTKAEAETERLRQITLRERGGREAVGLPLNELSAIIEARRICSRSTANRLTRRPRFISIAWSGFAYATSFSDGSNLIEVMADERWERLVEQQGIVYAKTHRGGDEP